MAKFSLKTARFHNSKNGKSPDLLDFFDGSGDVIRTHDTPGMKACVDEVQKMSEPKTIETSGACVCRVFTGARFIIHDERMMTSKSALVYWKF